MKYILVTLIFAFSSLASAHCPIPFTEGADNYCMQLEWQKGDRMKKGALEAADVESPYLNLSTDIPQKWIYSKVLIQVWKSGDTQHVPVQLPNLKVFAYMNMVDGMHHATTSKFSYSPESAGYLVSGFALQQMEGCWSLRYSLNGAEDFAQSQLLVNIKEFTNLDSNGLAEVAGLCDICAVDTSTETPQESGHHHH